MQSERNLRQTLKIDYIRKRLVESWPLYVLLLPGLTYLIIFMYGPMYGIVIGFKNFKPTIGILASDWIGLKSFIRFFNYPKVWTLIQNTLSISLQSLATFPVPIIFALLMNEIQHAGTKKTVQMITYMPHFLSEVVVCSLVILFLDRANGPINNLIAFLGGERTPFLANPRLFAPILVLSGLWQNLGWSSILYMSALSSVSMEEVEAARIDGANRLRIVWHVYVPTILPTIIITFIMRMGSILSVGYTRVLLLQNDLNLETSSIISTFTYQIGLVSGDFSYSTAIGLFNNIVNFVILISANSIIKKLSGSGLF